MHNDFLSLLYIMFVIATHALLFKANVWYRQPALVFTQRDKCGTQKCIVLWGHMVCHSTITFTNTDKLKSPGILKTT